MRSRYRQAAANVWQSRPKPTICAPTLPSQRVAEPMAIAQVEGSATEAARRAPLWSLSVGSLGVVYGDIGTSPLYALKESLSAASDRGPVAPEAVYGVVSLIL